MRSGTVSHLFVLQGLQADPLVQAWQARWPERITVINLLEGASAAPQGKRSGLQLHEAADAEDEAQRAAACVLRHLQAGRFPVALATTDRVVSRRVQALLSERGVAVRDETGWRLSTTRAAATLLRTLELWAPEPATDGVIDWLQHVSLQPGAGITPAAVMSLEARARQLGIARWPDFARAVLGGTSHASPPPRDQGGRAVRAAARGGAAGRGLACRRAAQADPGAMAAGSAGAASGLRLVACAGARRRRPADA
jgi:inactivated superfamily I helicase